MRKFKDLEVWKIGFDVMLGVYDIAKQLPKEEKYGLGDQIRRASVSIPSNIAEGCSRTSELEFKRYLEIAMGSTFELETQLLAIDALGLVSKDFSSTLSDIGILQRKLNSLIQTVKTRTK